MLIYHLFGYRRCCGVFVTSRTYVRWSCLQSARRRRLGRVELGSAVLSARAGDTDCDGRSSTYSCSLHSHTRAVEPLVPYVDNIHEVIKKPFVAKGPQQFAMKACNSSNLCYSVVVCARRQELQPPPVPSLAARDTITQLLPHGEIIVLTGCSI